MEKEVVSINSQSLEIGQKTIKKEEQKWRPSPWNKQEISDRRKPIPIMMCKRCKKPR